MCLHLYAKSPSPRRLQSTSYYSTDFLVSNATKREADVISVVIFPNRETSGKILNSNNKNLSLMYILVAFLENQVYIKTVLKQFT